MWLKMYAYGDRSADARLCLFAFSVAPEQINGLGAPACHDAIAVAAEQIQIKVREPTTRDWLITSPYVCMTSAHQLFYFPD